MLIGRIRLQNLLSFGPDSQELDLRPLNVLIGPNGSGKSNLIEAFSLLQAAPKDLKTPIREGGGVGDWIWRGQPEAGSARIEVTLNMPSTTMIGGDRILRYCLGFMESRQRSELTDERIETMLASTETQEAYVHFDLHGGRPILNYRDRGPRSPYLPTAPPHRQRAPEEFDFEQSILSQRKDPDAYPELTWLGDVFARMRLYREWSFGRHTPSRMPQKADLPNDFLSEDGRNLGLVLNRLKQRPEVRRKVLQALQQLYEGVTDFHVGIEGSTVQVYFEEGNIAMPATRLSDGTLRFLSLLIILCHPEPPPLVCIEEPELGLHPDVLPVLADLMREASEHCQLIVTTHSDVLVDALSETPESVVVCEKDSGQTTLRRLDKDDLSHWLERYRLGELWSSGELGGNRW